MCSSPYFHGFALESIYIYIYLYLCIDIDIEILKKTSFLLVSSPALGSLQVMEALREKRFFGLAFRAARPLVPARSRSGDGGK